MNAPPTRKARLTVRAAAAYAVAEASVTVALRRLAAAQAEVEAVIADLRAAQAKLAYVAELPDDAPELDADEVADGGS